MSAEQKAKMRELWEAGELTAREIGERFGVSANSVIGYARRGGWKPRRQSYSPRR